MKKKLLSIILVGMIAIIFTACGNGKSKEEEQKKAEYEKIDKQAAELESLIDSSLPDGMAKIKEYGFTATYLNAGTDADMTEIVSGMSDEDNKAYTITDVSASGYDKTVKVYIASEAGVKSLELESALKEKLDPAKCWTAVKNYGETQYPYGFDLHSFAGVIAQEASDENTWFLKATCDVTNEYGAEAEMTCEAHVTGTSDSPQIVDFTVY